MKKSESPKQQIASVTFVDGCVLDSRYIYVAAKLDTLDPEKYTHTRLFYFFEGRWYRHDRDWNITSVCVRRHKGRRESCALSIEGDVEFQWAGGGERVEKIKGAGISGGGAMMQIKEVGKEFFACGYGGQVYQWNEDGWNDIAYGLRVLDDGKKAPDICSVDGESSHDLYAVGFGGRIFHRKGEFWSELDSPTTENLERVVWHEGKMYACGKSGIVVMGNTSGFTCIQPREECDDFWGITVFGGAVYISALSGVYMVKDSKIVKVDMNLSADVGSYRIDSCEGALWSFGPKDILCFDGKKWECIEHPDNEEKK